MFEQVVKSPPKKLWSRLLEGGSGALTLSVWEVIQTSLPFPLAHVSVHIICVQLLQYLAFYISMCMHPDGHEINLPVIYTLEVGVAW